MVLHGLPRAVHQLREEPQGRFVAVKLAVKARQQRVLEQAGKGQLRVHRHPAGRIAQSADGRAILLGGGAHRQIPAPVRLQREAS